MELSKNDVLRLSPVSTLLALKKVFVFLLFRLVTVAALSFGSWKNPLGGDGENGLDCLVGELMKSTI